MAGGYVAFTDGQTTDAQMLRLQLVLVGTTSLMLSSPNNGSGMNNMQDSPTVTYTQAIQGQQAAAGGVTFAGNASITDLTYAFDSAVMPTGEDVSLTGMVGVMVLAGHRVAFPTATYDEVMADAGKALSMLELCKELVSGALPLWTEQCQTLTQQLLTTGLFVLV